jgi:ribosomal protein L7/L12
MPDLQKIVEELSQLTVMQIADLTKQLELNRSTDTRTGS